MSDWTIVAGPAATRYTSGLDTASQRRFSFDLTEPSTFTFALDGRHDEALGILELATDVHALRESDVLYTGRVASCSDTMDGDAHPLTVVTKDTRWIFSRRLVQTTRSYTDADVGAFWRDMLIDGQAGTAGGLNVTIPAAAPVTGVTFTREVKAGASILAELQAVAGTVEGAGQVFDWDITPGWGPREPCLWAPARGRDNVDTLTWIHDPGAPYSSSIATLPRVLEPGAYANQVYFTGGIKTVTVTPDPTTPVVVTVETMPAVTVSDEQSQLALAASYRVQRDQARVAATQATDPAVRVAKLADAGRYDTLADRATAAAVTASDVATPSLGVVRGNRTVRADHSAVALGDGESYTPILQPLTENITATDSGGQSYTIQVPTEPVTLSDGTLVWETGIWATARSYPDIVEQDELQARAQADLDELRQVTPTYQIRLRNGYWEGPAHIWLGDSVQVVIRDGRLNEDVTLRVTHIDVELDDDNTEHVTLTVGRSIAVDPTSRLLTTLIEQQKRIAELQRLWAS